MKTLALCSNFKDEELNAEAVFGCVKDFVDEWVVVDSGSTDSTVEICKDLGARVFQITHPMFVGGYGGMRTLTANLSKCDWVLILDGDERINPEDAAKLKDIIQGDHDFIWLPRQHYRVFDMSIVETRDGILENPTPEQCVENIKAHPDWQPRLFMNKPEIVFERMVHERVTGYKNPLLDVNNPIIRHFGFLKTDARLQAVAEMCDELWKEDKANASSYVEEQKYGHATISPAWREFWKKHDKYMQKGAEWIEEYRRYWKSA